MSRPAPRLRMNVIQTFLIGYLVWMLPMMARASGDYKVTTKLVVYGSVWMFLLFAVAVTIVVKVYGFMSARKASLKASASIALVSTVPAIMVFYLIDMWIQRMDPSLSCAMLDTGKPISFGMAMGMALADGVGICLLLAAVVFIPVFARAHDERIRELETVRRDADLLRLRSHLEPHFVLNSLNAVAGLLEEEPAQARELLAALGDLFRDAVRCRATHSVADEVEWLRRYVMIHELRHPEMLRTSWEIDEKCLDLECPALILQPLVENAVKHGALRGGGHLKVRATRRDGVLAFSVEDDGPELGEPRPDGQGLAIVRRRLALEELPESAFELVREAGQTIARVCLPARVGVRHA